MIVLDARVAVFDGFRREKVSLFRDCRAGDSPHHTGHDFYRTQREQRQIRSLVRESRDSPTNHEAQMEEQGVYETRRDAFTWN